MRSLCRLPLLVLIGLVGFFGVTASKTALSVQPSLGRLIRLDVVGPQDVKVMLEAFLTGQNLLLVDDDNVVRLRVRATKEVAGHPRNARVRVVINRLERSYKRRTA